MRWLVSLFAACLLLLVARPSSAAPEAIVAYVFPKDSVLKPDAIAAGKLTRINYAFADIRDGEVVEGFLHDDENYRTLIALKQKNPKLTVLASVGGWTWSGTFSDAALTRISRKKFIDSAVRFVEKHRLDGIDIDWEYPGLPGIGNKFRPEDKENYTALLKELRERFNAEETVLGRPLFTSVATGANPNFLEHAEMGEVAKYVTTVNLMSYDYYESSSDRITGNHAPLFTDPADPKKISADASVKLYIAAGVPANKIVLGVPFYGHAWAEVSPKNDGLFQSGKPIEMPADYNMIVDKYLTSGYVRHWDAKAAAPTLYNPATKIFISYEDVDSLDRKCRYVLGRKLGGIMFWEYHGDAGEALLNTINRTLRAK